jgi:spermidine synthase
VGGENTIDPAAHLLLLDDYHGQRALEVDGVIFSVAVEAGRPTIGYWTAMLPEGRPRSALLLGLGAGTLAHLLSRHAPGVKMTGVDIDPRVVHFGREHFGLEIPNLQVVIADAFQYVYRCSDPVDYIAVDLFVGRRLHTGILAKPFLRRLSALLAPGGEIAINLLRDVRNPQHLERFRELLAVNRIDQLPSNLILHCSARGPSGG